MPPERLPEVAELCKKTAEEIGGLLGRTGSAVRIPGEVSFS
jgi:hypothetical protein